MVNKLVHVLRGQTPLVLGVAERETAGINTLKEAPRQSGASPAEVKPKRCEAVKTGISCGREVLDAGLDPPPSQPLHPVLLLALAGA